MPIDPNDKTVRAISQIESYFSQRVDLISIENAHKGMDELILILKQNDVSSLEDEIIKRLTNLVIICVAVFNMNIKLLQGYFLKRKTVNQAAKALRVFRMFLSKAGELKYEILIQSIVEVLDVRNLLAQETICENILIVFLNETNKRSGIVRAFLDKADEYAKSESTINKSLNIFKWISDVTTNKEWPSYDNEILMRILKMHIHSIFSKVSNTLYSLLHPGLEICIKRIIKKTSQTNLYYLIEYVLDILVNNDLSQDALNDIGFSLNCATKMYKLTSIAKDMKYSVLKNILLLIASENRQKCLLGNRAFQTLIDLNHNIEQLNSPKIFFMEIKYNLKIKNQADALQEEQFIKEYRQELHVTFLQAVINQKQDISTLESIYSSIALLMTEIPCSFTAAFISCLVMHMQFTFLEQPPGLESTYRVHATVISLLSLVCWTMNIKVLYAYLNKILKLRAHTAPFLNPPLRKSYFFANNYILWNKPDFFFEDFEVRYALWRRFRLNEQQITEEKSYERIGSTQSFFLKKNDLGVNL